MTAEMLSRAALLPDEGRPSGYLSPLQIGHDVKHGELQLAVLARPGCLVELRAKRPGGGMVQDWHTNWRTAAAEADRISKMTDVYVGVLPRLHRSGGKNSVTSSRILWVECDTPHSVDRALELDPNMVVCSSNGKAHCYWSTLDELSPDAIEIGNKRLAWSLGGDMAATDAARILRVAGTYNHKYGEPKRVFLAAFGGQPRWSKDLVGTLPDPTPPSSAAVRPRRPKLEDPTRATLRTIPADRYVEALAGRDVVRGMARCPFHKGGEERTPSLHVSGMSDTLWHCFGCDEGSDIFGFAARAWGLDVERDFKAIVDRLAEIFA